MSTETSAPFTRDWATKFGIKAYRYRALVKRRWWILAATVAFGLLCEVWILVRQPVRFESTGKLVVGGGMEDNGGPKITEDLDGFYNTQIKIIQGDPMKERARHALELTDPQLHGSIEILSAKEPQTKLFDIVGQGSNPQYTQRYIETLMQQYILYHDEQNKDVSAQGIAGLTAQIQKTGALLAEQQKTLQDFVNAHGMASWVEVKKAAVDTLNSLKKQQADKNTLLNQLKTLTADQILSQSLLGNNGSKTSPEDTSSGGGAGTPDLSQQYLQANQELAQKKAELCIKTR